MTALNVLRRAKLREIGGNQPTTFPPRIPVCRTCGFDGAHKEKGELTCAWCGDTRQLRNVRLAT